MTTPTPRTDALWNDGKGNATVDSAIALAEELERELAAAQEARQAAEARAEQNAKDAERLQWLIDENAKEDSEVEISFLDLVEDGSGQCFYPVRGDLRAAIDAAIAGEPK